MLVELRASFEPHPDQNTSRRTIRTEVNPKATGPSESPPTGAPNATTTAATQLEYQSGPSRAPDNPVGRSGLSDSVASRYVWLYEWGEYRVGMESEFERITVDPSKMRGAPCIRGLRVPVATVLGQLAAGVPSEQILLDFPDLEPADIPAALEYAAAAVQERELPGLRLA